MIADSGGTFSMAAYVEMITGDGSPPVQKVLDPELRPSLSIEWRLRFRATFYANDPGVVFFESRSARSSCRLAAHEDETGAT